jgi:hypothetical protein
LFFSISVGLLKREFSTAALLQRRQIQSGNFAHPREELLSIVAASAGVRVEVPAANLTTQLRFFAFRRKRIGNLNAPVYIDGMP